MFCFCFPPANQYLLKYPREEYKTGRKLRCSPLHTRLEVAGAVFGEIMAYERATYFNNPEGIFKRSIHQ